MPLCPKTYGTCVSGKGGRAPDRLAGGTSRLTQLVEDLRSSGAADRVPD